MSAVLDPKPEVPVDTAGMPVGVQLAVDPPSGVGRGGTVALFALPVLLGAGVYAAAVAAWVKNPVEVPDTAPYYDAGRVRAALGGEPDGPRLYAQHCAFCHGANGDGKGLAVISPKARHFGFEKFKFTDTGPDRTPTDDALLATLRRGIPGSAMPSFAHLPEPELRAILGHVRYLTRGGVFARLLKKVADDGDDPDFADLSKKADAAAAVGEPLKLPAGFPPATPESVANGRRVFLSQAAACSTCHGPGGKGDGPQAKDLKNEDKVTPNPPRDLTSGVFKGGSDPASLYRRIKLGIPGTPMPAAPPAVTDKDVIDLIHFVRSLSRTR
jgi:mono/diheme cytochrome c family protein